MSNENSKNKSKEDPIEYLNNGKCDIVVHIDKIQELDNSKLVDLVLDFFYSCNNCKEVIRNELNKRLKYNKLLKKYNQILEDSTNWNELVTKFKSTYSKYDDFCNRSDSDNDIFTAFTKELIEGENE